MSFDFKSVINQYVKSVDRSAGHTGANRYDYDHKF